MRRSASRRETVAIQVPVGVYAPQDDTRLLLAALRQEALGPSCRVLDIGTGSGALAIEAARLGARVHAVDVSRRAVLAARFNAWRQGQYVRVTRGDLASVAPAGGYDLLLSNPPYVPSPQPAPPRRGPARAWDAGPDGRAVIDRICATSPRLLRPGGRLLMVHSALSDTPATLRNLAAHGLEPEVVDRVLVPFGPVLRSRLGWLRDQGLLDADEDKEELVVIRAIRI
ncbi:methyltransferase [Streptomyces sp. NBC_00237]|uniref:HemK2/MTQ2 family protein methyltransferase n=1 Tax=Streptomyces sp. NBC_00237 TaxID=2975687 RepID=UPI0022521903|nr:HemK2/MTQ2 family protein methyltransferase [Streptomyces sp. NBC_00237]MCX5206224.1 methyltransferase [Streptomyces sp. NBC_00237]